MHAKHKIKIHLLFISLEALNLYSSQKYNYNHFIEYFKSSIPQNRFIIWPFNSLLKSINYNNNKISHFKNILIYIIYSINNYYWIHNLIKIILYSRTKNHKYELLNKYIYKFTYIYNKTYNYYYRKATSTRFEIEQIAITNLYIIQKVITQKNISYLIHYLLS